MINDPCIKENITCSNNGFCQEVIKDHFRCQCSESYSGQYCQCSQNYKQSSNALTCKIYKCQACKQTSNCQELDDEFICVNKAMTTGEIVGIVMAIIFSIAIILGIGLFFIYKKNQVEKYIQDDWNKHLLSNEFL